MNILKNKKLLAIAAIVVCSSTSANATSKSGCHSGGGSTGGSNTGGTTTLPVCDAWQGELEYNLYNGISYEGSSNSAVVVDGVSIQVSTWSDTGDYNGNYHGTSYDLSWTDTYSDYGVTLEDETIQRQGNLKAWSSEGGIGYGLSNKDSTYQLSGDSHSIDNFEKDRGTIDYDMVLFSFSEEVSLDGALFSWLTDDSALTQQVSVVGLTQQGFDSLSSGHATWGDIVSNTSNFVSAGSFQIEVCAPGYEADFGPDMKLANYWLVGAYNAAFGSNNSFTVNDDGFKLASIGFSKAGPDTGTKPPTDVNAPSSFALLILGGGLMAWRRRKA